MDWLRLWHDMPTDPKWRVIALRAAASISEVIAVYTFVLVNASCNNMKRGETHGIVSEDIAAALGIAPEVVEKILAAMQGKVLTGNQVTGWDKRQTRRDVSSTSRVQAHRDRKLKQSETRETRFTVSETHETTDKKRLEEIRKETTKPSSKIALMPSAVDQEFEEDWPKFWARIARKDALNAYRKARKGVSREVLMAAVVAHGPQLVQEAQQQGRNVVHPATWLNAGRWTDEQSTFDLAVRPRDGPKGKTEKELYMEKLSKRYGGSDGETATL